MANSEYEDCINNIERLEIHKLFRRTMVPKYPRLISAMSKFMIHNATDAGIIYKVMAEIARCEHLKQSEDRN